MKRDGDKKETEQNGSLLFRLWNRSAKTKEGNEAADAAEVRAASSPAPAAPSAVPPVKPQEGVAAAGVTVEDEVSVAAAETAAAASASEGEHARPPEGQERPAEGVAVDAQIEVLIASDKMTASVRVTPPCNGGGDVTLPALTEALEKAGVTFGIRETTLKMISNAKLYQKPIVVAYGVAPQDGADGRIEDHFSRNHALSPRKNEDGSVDFKDLNLVRIVRQGDKICTIYPPGEPADGSNVLGTALHGRPGKKAVPPRGKNTQVSQDETALIASCDGNLIFSDEKFEVEDELHISGNIDNGSGNIDFCGNIVIDGAVMGGFTVKSEKDITVNGHVEGASLEAGGDINLNKGMNGMGKGTLKAGKNIRSRFLENCILMAGESIVTETIMNCTANAEDKIIVEGKRGVLVGGTYTAHNLIEAKTVGGQSNVATTLVVGASPDLLREQKELAGKLKKLEMDIDTLTKDVMYLEKRSKVGQLTPAQQDLYRQKAKQKMVALVESGQAQKQLDKVVETIESTENCQLKCGVLYPRVKIVMRNDSVTTTTQENSRLFYWKDGHICRGQLS